MTQRTRKNLDEFLVRLAIHDASEQIAELAKAIQDRDLRMQLNAVRDQNLKKFSALQNRAYRELKTVLGAS